MFESLKEKLTQRDLSTVITLVRIFGALCTLATYFTLLQHVSGDEQATFVLCWYPFTAVLSFATAYGINHQQMWGKWAGYLLGVVLLLNIPIGTIIGIALISRVRRASKAGWFITAVPPA